jgi:hypothetical protein
MFLNGNLPLRQERTSNTPPLITHELTLNIGIGLRKAKTKDDNQDRRASTKPVKWAPSVGRRVNEPSRKRRRQEIAKRITLLQHARDQTTSLLGTVLQGGGGGITIQATHGHTKQGTAGQELLVVLAETRAELERNEEDIVHDKRPLAAVPIGRYTEDGGPNRTEHEHQGDAPCDLGRGLAEGNGEIRDRQADGEEIKSVPCLHVISKRAFMEKHRGRGRDVPNQ